MAKIMKPLLLVFFLVITACCLFSPQQQSSLISFVTADKTYQPKVLVVGSGINAASTTFFLQALMQEEWRFCCIAQNLKGVPTMFDKVRDFWKNRSKTVMNEDSDNDPENDDSDALLSLKRKYVYNCEHVSCDTDDDRAVEFTVVEQDETIGGRVRSHQLEGGSAATSINDDGEPAKIELGASVYHKVNFYLAYFAESLLIQQENDQNRHLREFKEITSLKTHPCKSAKVGIWNSNEFVFKEHPSLSLKTKADALWRYHLSPIHVAKCVDAAVQNLLRIYKGQLLNRKSFKTSEELLERIDLLRFTQQNMTEYFSECAGVKQDHLFMKELAHAFTRINYGQSLELSALAGAVALYGRGDDVSAVQGGNYRIIEALFRASGVSLKRKNLIMNTKVSLERPDGSNSKQIFVVFTDVKTGKVTKKVDLDSSEYDAVILAHPNWNNNEQHEIEQEKHDHDKKQEVIAPKSMPGKITHITIAEASGCWNHSAFGYSSQTDMPTIVCTSTDVMKEKEKVFFRSVGKLRVNDNDDDASSSCLFKIFSDEQLSVEHQLDKIFKGDQISIVANREWNAAYPILIPIKKSQKNAEEEVEENTKKQNKNSKKKGKKFSSSSFILGKSRKFKKPILYAGALERFVSTMETQSISAMNTALLLRDLWGGQKLSAETKEKIRELKLEKKNRREEQQEREKEETLDFTKDEDL